MKTCMANYVIRIYRFEENNPRALVGLVEEVGQKGKKGFTNYDELWEILNLYQRESDGKKNDYRDEEDTIIEKA